MLLDHFETIGICKQHEVYLKAVRKRVKLRIQRARIKS